MTNAAANTATTRVSVFIVRSSLSPQPRIAEVSTCAMRQLCQKSPAKAGSIIERDMRGLDHRAPLLEAFFDEIAHLLWRRTERRCLQAANALLHIGFVIALADRVRQFCHDLLRRTGRRGNA